MSIGTVSNKRHLGTAGTFCSACDPFRMSAGRVFVVAEVAIVFVLLAISGLMMQSHERLLAIDPGCDARKLLTVRMAVQSAAWPATPCPVFTMRSLRGVAHAPELPVSR